MEAREAVRNSLIFKDLGEEELVQVLKISRERRFQSGDVIMQEGEKGDSMYWVAEGEVEVSKTLTMKFGDDDFRKAEKVLTRFRPEDHAVFGEMALIALDNRSATIMANTDCVLFEIRRDDFIGLVEDSPELGVKVLLKLAELLVDRLRRSSQDVMRLTTALSIALSK